LANNEDVHKYKWLMRRTLGEMTLYIFLALVVFSWSVVCKHSLDVGAMHVFVVMYNSLNTSFYAELIVILVLLALATINFIQLRNYQVLYKAEVEKVTATQLCANN